MKKILFENSETQIKFGKIEDGLLIEMTGDDIGSIYNSIIIDDDDVLDLINDLKNMYEK